MFNLNVNGVEYQYEEDLKLIDYLRDVLKLKGVKDGCAAGACGACSVIADGKLIRACIMKLSKLVGKKIITIEGLTEREKDVYGYAFAKAGAVQCGFCIPGMVMAAKALIDVNNDPTRDEIKKAIRGNICRCTGYIKIIDAIVLAAELIRTGSEVPENTDTGAIGERTMRVDAIPKTLGTGKYVDDYEVEGMVYGKAIRPPAARCKVLSIDPSKALEMEGVIAVYTADDIPGDRYIGHLQKDYPVMIAVGEETRFIGDAVALIVTETKELLDEAIKAVEIEYEELTPINNPFDAMKEDAPQIHAQGFMQFGKHFVPENNVMSHQQLKRGDVEAAFARSKYFSEHKFEVPFTEHAFMEPEAAIGIPENGGVRVITGGQGIFDEYRELTDMLGLEEGQVRIQSAYVGGGFGGKEDMSCQHHAALMAYLSQKPVKVLFSRQESINVHPKRHAMWIDMKVGCDENGKLQGMKAEIISDTGAYSSLGGPVLQRACTHAGGPYSFTDVDIEGRAYFTNNPPGGAFRGFGVTQSCFAMESCINDLAQQVGISGWEIRKRNAVRIGESLPNGQIADEGTSIYETIMAVEDYYKEMSERDDVYVGIACAMKNAGLGVGVPDIGRCKLAVIDGKVHIRTSAGAIGQGMQTIIYQMTINSAGLKPEDVVVEHPDSDLTPDSGTTTASRQTVFTGEAVKAAGLKLREALKTKTLEELNGEIFYGEYSFDSDPMGSPKPNPVSHVAYGYATEVVVIDSEGKVIEVLASHDSGTIINPTTAEGQVEGGVLMSMGYAVTEDFPLLNGIPQVKYGTLGLLRATDAPDIKVVFKANNDVDLAFGAKGIGEIAAIPAAPAIQNAYYKKDGIFRTKLPLENTFYKKAKK